METPSPSQEELERIGFMVKLKMPKGVCSASWKGKNYNGDKPGGIVEVPAEAVLALLSHGLKLAEDNPATRNLLKDKV